jgi:hypothetical protein
MKKTLILIYVALVVFMFGFGVSLSITNSYPNYTVPLIIMGGVYAMSVILAFTLPLFIED